MRDTDLSYIKSSAEGRSGERAEGKTEDRIGARSNKYTEMNTRRKGLIGKERMRT